MKKLKMNHRGYKNVKNEFYNSIESIKNNYDAINIDSRLTEEE